LKLYYKFYNRLFGTLYAKPLDEDYFDA